MKRLILLAYPHQHWNGRYLKTMAQLNCFNSPFDVRYFISSLMTIQSMVAFSTNLNMMFAFLEIFSKRSEPSRRPAVLVKLPCKCGSERTNDQFSRFLCSHSKPGHTLVVGLEKAIKLVIYTRALYQIWWHKHSVLSQEMTFLWHVHTIFEILQIPKYQNMHYFFQWYTRSVVIDSCSHVIEHQVWVCCHVVRAEIVHSQCYWVTCLLSSG